MVGDWYSITIDALLNLWQGFLEFIPVLIGAIVIFVIGWFIALGIGKLVTEILSRLKFNTLFDKTDWQKAFSKAKLDVNPSEFFKASIIDSYETSVSKRFPSRPSFSGEWASELEMSVYLSRKLQSQFIGGSLERPVSTA